MADVELYCLQCIKSYIRGLKKPLENDDPEDLFTKGALWAANCIEDHLDVVFSMANGELHIFIKDDPNLPEVMKENVRNKLDKTKHINL